MKQRVIAAFEKKFGRQPDVVVRAPGRLEILGNHTDYNEGTVLSVAVDRAMTIAAGKTQGSICELYDDIISSSRSFAAASIGPATKGDWANYIKGIVLEFQRRGIDVPAFQATLAGTVPLSAGMSSSAALEMAMVIALQNLTGANLSWLDQAKIGQAAENRYVGANTGLLDQVSSLRGRHNQLVCSDFRSMEVHNVPMPDGAAFVVANCMVKHNLTNEYNERREACEDAARTLGVKALRDVSPEQLLAAKDRLNPISFRRALHVVGEIDRVARGSEALANGRLDVFGQLMFESHQSSIDNFENSIPELDTLVDIAKTLPGAYGARLSGGGFGGITVHLVRKDTAEQYRDQLVKAYKERTGLETQAMICEAAEGAAII